jgi:cytochrome bd ubiquinol oxidase subunit II
MPRRKRPPDRRNQPPRDYALGVMTVVALIVTPILLVYQGSTYYIFRHRLGGDAHAVDPVELVARKTGV